MLTHWFVMDTTNASQWRRIIDQLECADVFYTPEYCNLYEKNGEGMAQCFVYQEGDNLVCYPFLLRKIKELPRYANSQVADGLYDIVTPYGYGGPITNVAEPAERLKLLESFERIFDEYCKEKRIVTEFVRFHPLLRNHDYYLDIAPQFNRNTVYIDLRLSEEEIQEQFSGPCKNRIRKAVKEGLTVHSTKSGIESFITMYYATMDKLGADSFYYFPKETFYNTMDLLEGNSDILEVHLNEKVILSGLFLHYGPYLHFHLIGSDKDYLHLAPTNLLFDYAAKWGKANGFTYLHLGGGYKADDSLYRFKKHFNKGDDLDFYIGKKVRCAEEYRLLTTEFDGERYGDYFPIYRHPRLNDPISIAQ
ncbi:lipid II:glycine glycyltransferase FemX [Paenibacillus contaminans]|nr:GNAT family N-acetyltransferase [Paenibacillus contaminans]